MKKVAPLGLLILFIVLLFGAPVSAQSAPSAPRFKVSLNKHALHSGDVLTVTATASIACEWVLEWNDVRRHAVGSTFTTTFRAPTVTKARKIPLHALCVYDQDSSYGGSDGAPAVTPDGIPGPDPQTIVVTIPDNWQDTVDVNVVPGGGVKGDEACNPSVASRIAAQLSASPARCPGDNGVGGLGGNGLPDTGGPPRWLIAFGALLVLAGLQVVRRAGARRTRPAAVVPGAPSAVSAAVWLPTYRHHA